MTDGRVGTVLHAADLHLGSPLKALGSRLDPVVSEHIRRAATRAFDNLVALALAESVDVVVLAGDVYDAAEYEVAAQLRFVKGLRRMTDAGIRVFIAHGNHDPLQKTMRLAAPIPQGVTVFAAGEPQLEVVEMRNGHELHVAGVSYARQAETQNLARAFHTLDTPSHATVGVLHANVGSRPGHDPYAPCSPSDLEMAPVGYWALGHIHQREVNALGAGRWWAYPGNLQGRSSKAAECGAKGVLLVPVLPGGFGEPEFRACAEVRFERLSVDVSHCDHLDQVLSAIDTALDTALDTATGTGAVGTAGSGAFSVVARLELTGRSAVHRMLVAEGPSKLLDLVQHELGTSVSKAVTKVVVSTGAPFDRERVRDRGDLLAALLERFDASDDPRAMVESVMVSLDGPARKRLAHMLATDPALAADICTRAEQLLIDRLEDAS